MTKFLIVTGTENSGKTTTMGMVYKKLLPLATEAYLADASDVEISTDDTLMRYGNPIDFISYLKINNKTTIAMISAGDVAADVKDYAEAYLKNNVDYIICCARTQNRKGSARRVLYDDFKEYPKEEFWPVYSDDKSQMFSVKEDVVEQIISKIL